MRSFRPLPLDLYSVQRTAYSEKTQYAKRSTQYKKGFYRSVIWITLFSVIYLLFPPAGFCEPIEEKESIPIISIKVTSVEVRGNRRLADEEILSLIKTEKGRDFDQAVLTEDLKTLYRQGWFADVGIDTRDEEGGKKVLFIVKEKPLLKQILFEGNRHLSSKYLKKQLSSELNEPLDGQKLKKDLNKLKEVYESRGFPYTEVEEKTEIDESNNQAVCRLSIKEGPRVRLREIHLSGNSSFSDKQILKLLRTKKKGFFRKGIFKKKVFKKDLERIGEFYRDRAYLDAKVNGSFEYEEKAIFVKIVIDEGRRYLTGKINLVGNVVFSRDELFEKLKMLTGAVFTYSSLYRDVAAIRDAYFEKGYLDVSVRPDVALTKDKDEVDVVYKITENKLSFVGEIRLRGNLKTKDKVIRRELRISPGERFDGKKVKRSIQRLYNLGFFEYVTYDTEATAEPGVKDIIFEVKEARTGQFAFGAGYSSVDRFVGFLEIEQKNFDAAGFPTFTGAGQDLKLRSEFGTRRKHHELSFTEPYLFDSSYSGGFDLYLKTRVRTAYDEEREGGALRVSKRFGEYFSLETSYRLEGIRIYDLDDPAPLAVQEEEGKNTMSSFSFGLRRDTRNWDSIFLPPAEGTLNRLSVECAGGPFGGDKDFTKYRLSSGWYFKHFKKLFLEIKLRGGVAEEFGDSIDVPVYERFYAGGAYTIRGYKDRDIGPKDAETDDPIGGKAEFIANLEYGYPLTRQMRLAVFYDTGYVWDELDDIDFADLKSSVGAGIRMNLPIPVRIDYGYGLDHEEGEKKGRFHISIGGWF